MNKNQIIFGVVAVVLIGGALYFFGGKSGNNSGAVNVAAEPATPSQTLVKFYELANQGLYSKLGEIVAPQMTNYVNVKTIAQTWTNFGLANPKTIVKVAPTRESIKGEGAQVYFDMTLSDGKVVRSDNKNWFYASLEKINGTWKIDDVLSCAAGYDCHSITDGY